MKAVFTKCVRFLVAFSIPVMLMVGCENDLVEPDNAPPPKSKMKKGAGVVKND